MSFQRNNTSRKKKKTLAIVGHGSRSRRLARLATVPDKHHPVNDRPSLPAWPEAVTQWSRDVMGSQGTRLIMCGAERAKWER
jgi:hypothetical protein